MALGWRMPQRARTSDLQTPGRPAAHTFEPRLGQAAALRAEFEFKLDDGDTVWGERAAEELLLLAGGAPGAPRSWASTYAQGCPMAVEALHGQLHGPPPQEALDSLSAAELGCGARAMETEMTPIPDTDIV
tara:strand:+ start:58 stop:450 length:393 start_codon:yes stop_codon:yes gene_type:complete